MRFFLLAVTTVFAFAQDADLVLRTAVSFNTRRASVAMPPELQAEVEQLGQQAQTSGRGGNYKQAMRDYLHGMSLMAKVPWTPTTELASGITLKLNDAIAGANQEVQVTLDSIYDPAPSATSGLILTLQEARPGGESISLLAPKEFKTSDLPATITVRLPEKLSGKYQFVATLGDFSDGGYRLQKTAPILIANLEADAAKLEGRLAQWKLPVAEYALVLYRNAEAGKANPHQVDFAKLFGEANQLLDSLEAGKDPFASRQGDIRQAYRSAVDQTLQPYRVYVPTAYQGKPLPLVVALHGMGGDENSMMDGYAGVFKREAERLGYLLVTPKGREPASMYRGAAEKDVLDVLAEVRRIYRIDPARIYLMGHSMGGYGTWSIAMAYPQLFAALGPIAGGGNPSGMAKIKEIPQIVVHGDDDRTVPVTQSRSMVEAGKKVGAAMEYLEVKGGNHVDIVVPNVPGIFDFFAKHSRESTRY
jgi:predicted esterase